MDWQWMAPRASGLLSIFNPKFVGGGFGMSLASIRSLLQDCQKKMIIAFWAQDGVPSDIILLEYNTGMAGDILICLLRGQRE